MPTFQQPSSSRFGHICGLRAFLPLRNLKLYRIALLQAFVSFGTYGAIVNENIRSVVAPYEPITLRVIEPLDSAFHTHDLRSSVRIVSRRVPSAHSDAPLPHCQYTGCENPQFLSFLFTCRSVTSRLCSRQTKGPRQ